MTPTTYVLGLGNVLMGDDGFGPAAVAAFNRHYVVEPDVSVVDIGTPGLDLTPWLADADNVIVVDTVKSDLEPGTLCVFDRGQILRHAPGPRLVPHDPGLKETLLMLEFAGRAPREVVLIGIVPLSVQLSLDLSPVVRAMVPAAARLVAATLRRLGATVTPRGRPAPFRSPVPAGEAIP
jgi:hydrogenase maturation protease